MNKPKIVIVMDGGVIQHIMADSDVEVAVIDYDVQDMDVHRLTAIPQRDKIGAPTPDSEWAYAYTQQSPDEIDAPRVNELFSASN